MITLKTNCFVSVVGEKEPKTNKMAIAHREKDATKRATALKRKPLR